ncbi:hypothetical protein D8674_000648 [Pyrus ussuriensis x Pyrus communis]|uniref:Uncharacterized protein n=1 Tax=Pyrus ussuriensis x Pyrus communis TaxID=2448454 RepID=A0A5N5F3S3_9ROSA|nr:hypothetical protein D8674_000648 [Pyrus ussuriensis x Pyrus communis]
MGYSGLVRMVEWWGDIRLEKWHGGGNARFGGYELEDNGLGIRIKNEMVND